MDLVTKTSFTLVVRMAVLLSTFRTCQHKRSAAPVRFHYFNFPHRTGGALQAVEACENFTDDLQQMLHKHAWECSMSISSKAEARGETRCVIAVALSSRSATSPRQPLLASWPVVHIKDFSARTAHLDGLCPTTRVGSLPIYIWPGLPGISPLPESSSSTMKYHDYSPSSTLRSSCVRHCSL